ncbi:MAG TPA: radical SAM protein [Myxococcota bacterium]|nr:radical SAM protein [Myxococcota bacterium]HRY96023.1 radical SAM protein [Myxococcota bacterium]HSA21887.1 radical SAM protein [Myxococcota bacterium]
MRGAGIRYDWPLYRPPSEADSLIFQATLGCSHNRCAFCVNYQAKRFRPRKAAELEAEIAWAARELPDTRRVFLADGDAFVLPSRRLLPVLRRLHEALPRLERVSAYAGPGNLRNKSDAELRELRQAGLGLLYFGLESGDDEVLRRIDKGYTQDEMVAACERLQAAGFDLSVTVILGLAGPRGSRRHAEATARALDRIRPRWAAALTLMLEPRQPGFAEAYGDPDWRPLEPLEILAECHALLSGMQADGVTFRSNHASNYLALAGELQRDKPALLAELERVLRDPRARGIRPDWMRAL